jgi:hypothetical protein
MHRFAVACLIVLAMGFVVPVNATLVDRGGGMIYDSDLNITWLQDANLGGQMDWSSAIAWADQLVYGGYSDWRLPHALPVNGSTYNIAPNTSLPLMTSGSSDQGWNISAPGSVYAGARAVSFRTCFTTPWETLGNTTLTET